MLKVKFEDKNMNDLISNLESSFKDAINWFRNDWALVIVTVRL